VFSHDERSRTAFVFAGGGSFGAIHVGMLQSLANRGIAADMVVGSSVGALNGAYYAGNPTVEGIRRLDAIWRGLRRNDVFPLSWRTIVGFLYRRDFLVGSDALRQLVDENTYRCYRYPDRGHRRDVGRSGCRGHHCERCGPGRVRAGISQRTLSRGWSGIK
jgi:hypothetical protein